MYIEEKLKSEIVAHLEATSSAEACGLIVDDPPKFVPCRNILSSVESRTGFQISAGDFKRYAGRLRAVVHSHIDGPSYPSLFDQERQAETAVPWAVGVIEGGKMSDFFWFGDGEAYREGFWNTPFRHGVNDCYELVRHWYDEHLSIKLPPVLREWEWWKSSDLLVGAFGGCGFRRLEEGALQPGDVAIIGVKTDTPHHCAIYLGNDTILHHPGAAIPYDPTRTPVREGLARWRKHIKFWLRLGADS